MYRKISLPFNQVPQFSERDIAYQEEDPALRGLYDHSVRIESFKDVIFKRKATETPRQLIHDVLSTQYEWLQASNTTQNNIDSFLKEDTFSIVTAHQPSLLTGPLYFIYKICSTISLAAQLNERYPDIHVVPVFVMGGEDHDFEEIATLHLFNRDFTWNTDQKGATGRMTLDGLREVLDSVEDTFGTMTHAVQLKSIIEDSFSRAQNYGQFIMILTNHLFAEHGLVILNMDNAALKKELLPLIVKDIKEEISQKSVLKDQDALKEAGLPTPEIMRKMERAVYLNVIDTLWMEHIDNMQQLRESVALKGYGQRDPLIEYKEQAFIMFQKLLSAIRSAE